MLNIKAELLRLGFAQQSLQTEKVMFSHRYELRQFWSIFIIITRLLLVFFHLFKEYHLLGSGTVTFFYKCTDLIRAIAFKRIHGGKTFLKM